MISLCVVFGAPTAWAQGVSEPPARSRFWQAVGGVAVANWVPWAYNWYVQRWPWARVGVQSWGHNLQRGFVWDNDCFLDNQLAHPYHGSMYHHSARGSGYGFWSSVPFVAAGSASWELFGENLQGSLNDLINTTIGGVALGEVTYRLSALLRSSGTRRQGGVGRGVGTFVASPIAAAYGLLDGRSLSHSESGPGSAGAPSTVAIGRQAGQTLLELAVQYGSPFGPDFQRPYDAFEFRIRVSPGSDIFLEHIGISGVLARQSLAQSGSSELLFGVFQHYDYDELPHTKSSGHSLSTALLYQSSVDPRHRLNLSAHAEGLLFGGVSSDHGFYWRRDYDSGPGVGARLAAAFSRDNREWLRLEGRLRWLHSIHGSDADHLTTFLRVGAAIPIARGLGIGGDIAVAGRHSSYQDLPSVTRRVSQLRGFVSWAP